MLVDERINAFVKLGTYLRDVTNDEFQSLAVGARNENAWFTAPSVKMAFLGISTLLESSVLKQWASGYDLATTPRKVAVIMAGNIPLVGFHDLLCVLLSGHNILIKYSSKDKLLPEFIRRKLIEIEPRFTGSIEVEERLKGFDAVIATGSDNTSRYFEYYFGKYPNIIRKNRTSVAILNGQEKDEDLKKLGTDVFSYFGLGCRNVSKVFLPEGFELPRILKSWESFHEWESATEIANHHKYFNNYEYQKSILLVTRAPFLDNGCVMMQENTRLVSPIAVLYYEFYKDSEDLNLKLEGVREKIQCLVGNMKGSEIKFGQSQFPLPGDYADQIDTLKFLTSLN